MSPSPSYLRVFLTFARNSLVRDMTFRTNFLIESVTSVTGHPAWVQMEEKAWNCPAAGWVMTVSEAG